MLNLTKTNKISFTNTKFEEKKRIKSSKHFPRSTREWKNSIYLYNKNNLNLIPLTDLTAISIIKTYFSLYNKEIEEKARTKTISLRLRRYSTNKIYVGNHEFKHTNDKVIIDLYLFNRQINNYNIAMESLKDNYLDWFIDLESFTDDLKKSLTDLTNKKLFLIQSLKNNNMTGKVFSNKKINWYINKSIKIYLYDSLNKKLNIMLLYWYYRQMLLLNESKYTYIYLQYLKEQIYQIYNKQVEFNFISLKKFYYSSDVVSEIITKKISRKRKKILAYIKTLKDNVVVKEKDTYIHKYIINKDVSKKEDLSKSSNSLVETIIKNIKYKKITGFKLEARGRLTKRYTASRSILKMIKKGNLLNIDSSLKGLSSVLLKGNLKSNTQYTKLASKSRIGSFGIKGWISSD